MKIDKLNQIFPLRFVNYNKNIAVNLKLIVKLIFAVVCRMSHADKCIY